MHGLQPGRERYRAPETRARRRAAFAFFHGRKEWIKFNAAYLVGSATNFGVGMATAYAAQRWGASKEASASWISALAGFAAGVGAMVISWYFLHVDKYQKDLRRIGQDTLEILKNVAKAQASTFAITIPGAWFLSRRGVPEYGVVMIQQGMDRLLFWVQLNIFSRHQVRRME